MKTIKISTRVKNTLIFNILLMFMIISTSCEKEDIKELNYNNVTYEMYKYDKITNIESTYYNKTHYNEYLKTYNLDYKVELTLDTKNNLIIDVNTIINYKYENIIKLIRNIIMKNKVIGSKYLDYKYIQYEDVNGDKYIKIKYSEINKMYYTSGHWVDKKTIIHYIFYLN